MPRNSTVDLAESAALTPISRGTDFADQEMPVELNHRILPQSGEFNMSKIINLAVGAAFAVVVGAPVHAADNGRVEAWSDAQVRTAMDKCKGLGPQERARCVVNIRPMGGGGSSLAVSVPDDKIVKQGVGNEEEYTAALKKCDSAEGAARDRCVADIKDHYGRM